MRLLPVKLFFIKKTKKFKKVVQNMSKRWSKTMPVRTPNPVFRESFFKFWNSHTNQVLKTPISSGRVTQLISAPWKVITSRRERGREEERGFLFWAHQRQGASRKNKNTTRFFHVICPRRGLLCRWALNSMFVRPSGVRGVAWNHHFLGPCRSLPSSWKCFRFG